MLWKKANRLDPGSEKDKVRFFFQNQFGAIMGVLAFLPLVILILMNKNIDGKTKGIASSIAAAAMLVAGITGVDFNSASIKEYTKEINQQTEELKKINLDNDNVYWTSAGHKYHLYEDCQHIKNRVEVSMGRKKNPGKKKVFQNCVKPVKRMP